MDESAAAVIRKDDADKNYPHNDNGACENNHHHPSADYPCEGVGVFCCRDCGAAFREEAAYLEHRFLHPQPNMYLNNPSDAEKDNETSYFCTLCALSFVEINELHSHLKNHHQASLKETGVVNIPGLTKQDNFVCSNCGKSYAVIGQLLNHLRSHGQPSKPDFNDPEELKKKPFQCETLRNYSQASTLDSHRQSHEGKLIKLKNNSSGDFSQIGESSVETNVNENQTRNDSKRHFECLCGKKFAAQSDLKTHQRFSSSGQCGSDEVKQIPRKKRSEFFCTECNKGFRYRCGLKKHQRWHTNRFAEKFTCEECGKVFTYQSYYYRHQRTTHTEENPAKSFLYQAGQVQKKAFECKDCGLKFSRVAAFRSHQLQHTHVGKETVQRAQPLEPELGPLESEMGPPEPEQGPLESEMGPLELELGPLSPETEHGAQFLEPQIGPRPPETEPGAQTLETQPSDLYDSQTFAAQSDLKTHQPFSSSGQCGSDEVKQIPRKKRSEFFCTECNRGFRYHSGFKTHQRWHTNRFAEKFTCEECGKAFTYQPYYYRHQRMVHTEETPAKSFLYQAGQVQKKAFECKDCGLKFSRVAAFQSHQLRHTHVGKETVQRAQPLEPELGPIEPELGPLEMELGPLKPELDPLEPEPGPLEPELGPLEPELGPLEPELGHLELELGPLEPELDPLKTELGPQSLEPEMGPRPPETEPGAQTLETQPSDLYDSQTFAAQSDLKTHQPFSSSGQCGSDEVKQIPRKKRSEFFCPECNRGFRYHSGFKTHQRWHTNRFAEKFTCEECGKAFTYQPYYYRHQRMVHTEENPAKSFLYQAGQVQKKAFECKDCGLKFSRVAAFQSHQLQHTHVGKETVQRAQPLEPELGPLEMELGPLEPELDPLEPELGPLESELDPLEPELGPLESELGPLESELGPLESELGPLESELGPLEPELGPQKSELGPLESGLGPLEPELGPLESELGPLESELGPLESELGPLEPELGPLESELGPLEPELGPLESELGPLEMEQAPLPPETEPGAQTLETQPSDLYDSQTFAAQSDLKTHQPFSSSGQCGSDEVKQIPRKKRCEFFCPECNKGFRYRCGLKTHQRWHTNRFAEKFTCEECGKVFTYQSYYYRHQRTTHTEENPAKSFLYQAGQVQKKAFECKDCGLKFSRVAAFRSHQLRHTHVGKETVQRAQPLEPELGPLEPELGPLEPELGPLEPELGPLESEPGPLEPELGPLESEMGPLESEMGSPEPEMGPLESELGPPESEQGPLESEQGPPEPEQGPLESELGPLESEVGPPEQEQGPPESEQGPLESEQGPLESEMGPPEPEQGPLESELGPPESEQGPLELELGPLELEQGPLESEQGPLESELGPPESEQGPLELELGPLESEQGPLESEQGPLESEQGPLETEQGPLESELGPLESELGPLESDMGPPEPEQGPLESEMGPPEPEQGPLESEMGPLELELGPLSPETEHGAQFLEPEMGPRPPETEPGAQTLKTHQRFSSSGQCGSDEMKQIPRKKRSEFFCPECNKGFRYRCGLKTHQRWHTNRFAERFTCEECGKVFTTQSYYYRHQRTAHTEENPAKSFLYQVGQVQKKAFECKDCGLKFSRVAAFRSHQLQHTHVGKETVQRAQPLEPELWSWPIETGLGAQILATKARAPMLEIQQRDQTLESEQGTQSQELDLVAQTHKALPHQDNISEGCWKKSEHSAASVEEKVQSEISPAACTMDNSQINETDEDLESYEPGDFNVQVISDSEPEEEAAPDLNPDLELLCESDQDTRDDTEYEVSRRGFVSMSDLKIIQIDFDQTNKQCAPMESGSENQTAHQRFHCPDCYRWFTNPTSLRVHRMWHGVRNRRHQNQGQSVACEISNYETQFIHTQFHSNHTVSSDLLNQAEGLLKKTFTCNECGDVFSCLSALVSHQLHHPKRKQFQCPDCMMSYVHATSLFNHMKTCSAQKRKDISVSKKEYNPKKTLLGPKIYHCEQCGKGFWSLGAFSHHKQNQMECTDLRLRKGLSGSLHSVTGRSRSVTKVTCPICGRKFRHKGTMALHMRRHENGNHKCEICSRSFRLFSSLVRHEVVHSDQLRPPPIKSFQHQVEQLKKNTYSCPDCGKLFSREKALQFHMKSHGYESRSSPSSPQSMVKVKNLHCATCFAHFHNKASLRAHRKLCRKGDIVETELAKNEAVKMRSDSNTQEHSSQIKEHVDMKNEGDIGAQQIEMHTDGGNVENPGSTRFKYKCNECDKSFPLAGALNSHKRIHIEGNESKLKSDIGRPLMFKTPNKDEPGKGLIHCSDCGRHFMTKSALGSHRRWHKEKKYSQSSHEEDDFKSVSHKTEDGPVQCKKCEKQFFNHQVLHRHQIFNPLCQTKPETDLNRNMEMDHPEQFSHHVMHCNILEVAEHQEEPLNPTPERNVNIVGDETSPSGEKPKPHQCPLCFVTFAKARGLHAHKWQAHPKNRKCKKKLSAKKKRSNSNSHVDQVEDSEVLKSSTAGRERKKIRSNPPSEIFISCLECGEQCSSMACLVDHKKVCSPVKQESKMEVETLEDAAEVPPAFGPLLEHTVKCLFKCDKCGKAFQTEEQLGTHKNKAKSRPHCCALCCHGFWTENQLQQHLAWHDEVRCRLPNEVRFRLSAAVTSSPSKPNFPVADKSFLLHTINPPLNPAGCSETEGQRHGRSEQCSNLYCCLICSQTFSHLKDLIDHNQECTNDHRGQNITPAAVVSLGDTDGLSLS